MIRKPGRGSDATTFIMRVYSLACAILGGTWCFGLAGTMWLHPEIFTVEPWYQLVLGIMLVTISAYGYFLSNHRVAVIPLVCIVIFIAGEMIWSPYIRLTRVFWAWGLFGVVQAAYGILLLVGLAFSLLHVIFVGIRRLKEQKAHESRNVLKASMTDAGHEFLHNMRRFKHVHASFLLVIAGSFVIVSAFEGNWFVPADATITLHPADYQIKFQFYGPSTYSYYTPAQRASLNNLGVRIIDHITDFITYQAYMSDPYLWWMNLTDYKQTADYQAKRTAIIDRYTPWLSGAPNVTFVYQLRGIPSGFPTDYSVTTGYWGVGALLINAWLTLEIIVEANLTNVVGLHTDQEDVSNDEPPFPGLQGTEFQVYRDWERNLQAWNNYQDFFQRMRYYEQNNATWAAFIAAINTTHAIDHFLFTTTYGSEILDGLDDDWDMDTFNINNVNSLPYDEFLPMLYNQHRFPPDNAHYSLYMQMKALQATLVTAGYPDHIGVLVGCMAASGSMFIGNYSGTQLVNGQQVAVTGFDVIARQVMIAKSFNCEYASFFPLNAYPGEGFWGIFTTFGDSFFDDLNATVNGPGSSAPYSIRYLPNVTEMETDLARDTFFSGGWDWYYLVALIAAFAGVWIHHACKPRAPRTTRKETPARGTTSAAA